MVGVTRRKVIGMAGASIACTAVGVTGATRKTTQAGRDWRMHQFDRGHTGYNPEATGITSDPSRFWEFNTGAEISPNAGPMLVDKRLYIASEDGMLRVLRIDEGRELWHFDMEATSVMTTPALGAPEGLVYVGGESAPLFAIDNQSGSVEWTREFRNGNFVGSPTYDDGTVYVARHSLFALDAATGETQWRAPDIEGVEGCVALTDDTVFAFGTEGRVDAVERSSGERVWSRTLPGPLHADYFETTVADGRVYVGGTDQSIYALSAESGETLWQFRPENVTEEQFPARSSPAVYEGTVFFGNQDGNVYALSAEDGSVEWSFEVGKRVVCSPAVANGAVYVGGLDGRMYALSADDGSELWSYGAGAGIRSSCVVSGDRLFFPTLNGHVVALRGESGSSESGDDTAADGSGAVRTPPDDGGDEATAPDRTSDVPRQRGFFTNGGSGPAVLENVFNLTVLGFLLSIVGIVHQLIKGR